MNDGEFTNYALYVFLRNSHLNTHFEKLNDNEKIISLIVIDNSCQQNVPFINDQFPGAENSSKFETLPSVCFARLFPLLTVMLLCCYYFTSEKFKRSCEG